MRIRTIAFCAATLLSGCYKTNYTTGAATSADPMKEYWHHRAINGIVEFQAPIDLGAVCPSGVARVHTEVSFVNGLVQYGVGVVVSPILYNPSTVQVWCKAGTAARITTSKDGVVEIEYTLAEDIADPRVDVTP